MSLQRRAEANVPAASYWLRQSRRVYYRPIVRERCAGGGVCDAPLACLCSLRLRFVAYTWRPERKCRAHKFNDQKYEQRLRVHSLELSEQ